MDVLSGGEKQRIAVCVTAFLDERLTHFFTSFLIF